MEARPKLTPEAARALLHRAAELDAAGANDLAETELREAAQLAGISDDAFDKALAELREKRSHAPPPSRNLKDWLQRAAAVGAGALAGVVAAYAVSADDGVYNLTLTVMVLVMLGSCVASAMNHERAGWKNQLINVAIWVGFIAGWSLSVAPGNDAVEVLNSALAMGAFSAAATAVIDFGRSLFKGRQTDPDSSS